MIDSRWTRLDIIDESSSGLCGSLSNGRGWVGDLGRVTRSAGEEIRFLFRVGRCGNE